MHGHGPIQIDWSTAGLGDRVSTEWIAHMVVKSIIVDKIWVYVILFSSIGWVAVALLKDIYQIVKCKNTWAM